MKMSKNKLFKVFPLLSFLAIPIFSGLISLTLSSESNKTRKMKWFSFWFVVR